MTPRRPLTLAVAALALAACDATRPVASKSATTTCTRCHGGAEDQSGAPPRDVSGRSDPALPSVGAHRAHVAAGVDCDACHPKPPAGDASHVDGSVALAFGPLATAGGSLPARYDGEGDAPTFACASVYCHGSFRGGNAANAPRWTAGASDAACGTCHALPPGAPHPAVEGGLAGCGTCHAETVDEGGQLRSGGAHANGKIDVSGGHPAAWMDPGDAGFHALEAGAGLASCQGCHGPDLDGGSLEVGCGDCHDANLPAGVASWRTSCVMCHGGDENATGAPPRATWGNAADAVRVGAHSAHLAASAVSPGFDCGVCHVKPADALSPGHVDGGTAELAFSGLAVDADLPAAAWDRGTATCSNTYCHGQATGDAAPVWTRVGQGEAACGSCHGLPPQGSHPAVSGGIAVCAGCHATTILASGALVAPAAGGTHLNGLVDADGHSDAWMDTASGEFHAFAANRALASCTGCHGATLDGGSVGVSCASCHDGTKAIAWSCVMCHGGDANQTGAPPKATWGNAADPIRVGAHAAHVSPSGVSPGFGCGVCHPERTSALAAGHANGATAVAFGGIAVDQDRPAPAWSRDAATCSNTYCHGVATGEDAPVWTRTGQGEAACGTCHGVPPTTSHPTVDGGLTKCATCHAPTVTAEGALIPPAQGGKHLNGVVDAQGHDAAWGDPASPGFHAFPANREVASCLGCHPAAPGSSATARSCDRCHTLPADTASWTVNCVMCHGGDENGTGAPPRATWGNGADPLRVGAHSKHVASTISAPIGCVACHPTPADAFTAGHLGDGTADVAFGGVATTGGVVPVWDRDAGTCATTYCHGNYSGTYTYTDWDDSNDDCADIIPPPECELVVNVDYAGKIATVDWDGGTTTCGSCHGNPPPYDRYGIPTTWHSGVHGGGNDCSLCHPDAAGTASTGTRITDRSKHVNGTVDVSPRWGNECLGCH